MSVRKSISKIPLIVILGATGTGKTKLGIELAQRFGTEIISADSMQVYKGLDIVTAKANAEEKQAAVHHLLDLLEPHQTFTVVDFRNRALRIIDNLMNQHKIPIVVGGTNYYIESVVWNILVEDVDESDNLISDKYRRKRKLDEGNRNEIKVHETAEAITGEKCFEIDKNIKYKSIFQTSMENKKQKCPIKQHSSCDATEELQNADESSSTVQCSPNTKNIDSHEIADEDSVRLMMKHVIEEEDKYSNEEIHKKLELVDPVMATRLHPNNRRKVLRSIEVWLKNGRRHSEVLKEQKEHEGRLRNKDTIILWLKCQQSILEARLKARIDSMLNSGLIQELLDFHHRYNETRLKEGQLPDYTKGIFQTLGFKEFHEYLVLPPEVRESEQGTKLLEKSVENMKLFTIRYAKRQNKMVQMRFLDHPTRDKPKIYALDTTDVTRWNDNVKDKAIHIIESFLSDSKCSIEPLTPSDANGRNNMDMNSYNYCNVCQRIIMGDLAYQIHLKSNKHKKMLNKLNKDSK